MTWDRSAGPQNAANDKASATLTPSGRPCPAGRPRSRARPDNLPGLSPRSGQDRPSPPRAQSADGWTDAPAKSHRIAAASPSLLQLPGSGTVAILHASSRAAHDPTGTAGTSGADGPVADRRPAHHSYREGRAWRSTSYTGNRSWSPSPADSTVARSRTG